MQSKAATVEQYLTSLPEDRRDVIAAVRKVILKNLDKDYAEQMLYGMICYAVPHRVFPSGYHCDPSKPLMFAGLASQKNHMALYLMCIYMDKVQAAWFEDAWKKSGKKLQAGKSCIRFKKLDDVPLEVVGEMIRRVPAKKYVDHYVKIRADHEASKSQRPAKKKVAAKKSPARKPRKATR
jgi:hypothetical protein